jgi:hypothetical protein
MLDKAYPLCGKRVLLGRDEDCVAWQTRAALSYKPRRTNDTSETVVFR